MHKIFLFTLLLFAFCSCSVDSSQKIVEEENTASTDFNHTLDVSKALSEFSASKNGGSAENLKMQLGEFYSQRNHCSMWFGTERPTSQLLSLKNTAYELINEGNAVYSSYADSIDYLIDIVYGSGQVDSTVLARADLNISAQFSHFANNLLEGQLESYSNGEAHWYVDQNNRDVLNDLARIQNGGQLDSLLNFYRPSSAEYVALLATFQKIQSKKDTSTFLFSCDFLDWDSLARDTMDLKLAERLNQWGFKNKTSIGTSRPEVAKSLARFQTLRGLENSGKLDCETVEQLNMSDEEVLEKIALNLERLKTLPRRNGKEYIMVNVPEYKLRVFRNGERTLEMAVIVGKEYNPTPIFVDTLSYLVFSPTWTVPQSIVQQEMIPNLRNDPAHYIKKNFKAYEGDNEIDQRKTDWSDKDISSRYFIFVQQPGGSNSLGLVKFIMPNDMSIYLHDTPADYLFNRTERSLSHGCVRLEKPQKLAEYLLADRKEWNSSKISEAMHSDSPTQVNLDKKIPVEIIYLTTWVNADGELAILPDVYGHDAEQKKLLSTISE